MKKYKTIDVIFLMAGVLLLAGALCEMLSVTYGWIVFSAGALTTVICRVMTNKSFDDFRLRRLQRIQFIAMLLLVFSAWLMYKDNNAWVITLILYALFDLIVAFRWPKSENPESGH